jgi:hypothetical protein
MDTSLVERYKIHFINGKRYYEFNMSEMWDNFLNCLPWIVFGCFVSFCLPFIIIWNWHCWTKVLFQTLSIAFSRPFCPSQTTYLGGLNFFKKSSHESKYSESYLAKPITFSLVLAIK